MDAFQANNQAVYQHRRINTAGPSVDRHTDKKSRIAGRSCRHAGSIGRQSCAACGSSWRFPGHRSRHSGESLHGLLQHVPQSITPTPANQPGEINPAFIWSLNFSVRHASATILRRSYVGKEHLKVKPSPASASAVRPYRWSSPGQMGWRRHPTWCEQPVTSLFSDSVPAYLIGEYGAGWREVKRFPNVLHWPGVLIPQERFQAPVSRCVG